MTNEEKRLINRAYAKGYRMFTVDHYDCGVDGLIEALRIRDYFQYETGNIESTVRAKLERLYRKNGYDPYYDR